MNAAGCISCRTLIDVLCGRYQLAVQHAEETTIEPDRALMLAEAECLRGVLLVAHVPAAEIERLRAAGLTEARAALAELERER
ncbi:MAG TPA: hypothetical protein PLE61_15455 [Vicinamibacterales bacterium]|nr:hypothetical protein [Vicinamibacterales bacterium]